jgi:hypothetical protein
VENLKKRKKLSKITIFPIAVEREIRQKVNEASPIIFELALEKFDVHQRIYFQQKFYRYNTEWHAAHPRPAGRDRGCGCDYCIALSRYVVERIQEHRLRRRMDNWWYGPYSHTNDQEALRYAREKWKYHKTVKDQIKQEVGLR